MRTLPGMCERITVEHIVAEVTYKRMRRIYLRVRSSSGPVQVSVPFRLSQEAVRAFIRAQIPWIEQQQTRHLLREQIPVPTYGDGELLMLWGRRYAIERVEHKTPAVSIAENRIRLRLPAHTAPADCARLLDRWRKALLGEALTPLVAQWAIRLGIELPKVRIRKMKTRWGSCSLKTRTVTFNLELARRSPACLEYLVVHELVHFIVQPHNVRFYKFLDQYLPQWSDVRRELNAQPIPG